MSSDSSDDENLDLLREATDSQFINDSMFNKKTSDSVIKETTSSKKDTLQSLRKEKDDDEQFNLFRVTPEFRNYVAKHLSRALEDKIQKILVTGVENNHKLTKKKQKSRVRLFSNSERFLKVGKNTSNTQLIGSVKPFRNNKLLNTYSEVDGNLLKEVAVDPNDILNKKDTIYWSNRSKAPIFHYKKSADGKLVLIEPEFK